MLNDNYFRIGYNCIYLTHPHRKDLFGWWANTDHTSHRPEAKYINYSASYFYLPISCQCSISIPPKNVRKPNVFCHFQGL